MRLRLDLRTSWKTFYTWKKGNGIIYPEPKLNIYGIHPQKADGEVHTL